MKATTISLLFALFSAAKSTGIDDCRTAGRPSERDIVRIMDRSIARFFATIAVPGAIFNEHVGKPTTTTTVKDVLYHVHAELDVFERRFVTATYNRVHDRLESYCRTSVELLDRIGPEDFRNAAVVERIKLDGQNSCAQTFLFNMGRDVDKMVRAMVFLRTLSEQIERDLLVERLNELHRLFSTESIRRRSHRRYDREGVPASFPKTKTVDELHSQLADIGNGLAELTEIYCLSTTLPPIVIDDVVLDRGKTDNDKTDPFLRYVYEGETCMTWFYSQSRDSFSYDCELIKESPEYGIEEYTKDVEVDESVRNRLLSTRRRNAENVNNDRGLLTLKSLKSKLKTKTYYLNFVKYSNVLLESVMSVLVKEGYKYLKVAYDLFTNRCRNSRDSIKADEIHTIRLKLFAFRFLFEKVWRTSELITHINPITIVRFFRKDVLSYLKILSIPNDVAFQDYLMPLCQRTFFDRHVFYDKPVYRGEKPDVIHFQGFYLNGPIVNARALMVNSLALFSIENYQN